MDRVGANRFNTRLLSPKTRVQNTIDKAEELINSKVLLEKARDRNYSPTNLNLTIAEFNHKLENDWHRDLNKLNELTEEAVNIIDSKVQLKADGYFNRQEGKIQELKEQQDTFIRDGIDPILPVQEWKENFIQLKILTNRLESSYNRSRDYSPSNRDLPDEDFQIKVEQDYIKTKENINLISDKLEDLIETTDIYYGNNSSIKLDEKNNYEEIREKIGELWDKDIKPQLDVSSDDSFLSAKDEESEKEIITSQILELKSQLVKTNEIYITRDKLNKQGLPLPQDLQNTIDEQQLILKQVSEFKNRLSELDKVAKLEPKITGDTLELIEVIGKTIPNNHPTLSKSKQYMLSILSTKGVEAVDEVYKTLVSLSFNYYEPQYNLKFEALNNYKTKLKPKELEEVKVQEKSFNQKKSELIQILRNKMFTPNIARKNPASGYNEAIEEENNRLPGFAQYKDDYQKALAPVVQGSQAHIDRLEELFTNFNISSLPKPIVINRQGVTEKDIEYLKKFLHQTVTAAEAQVEKNKLIQILDSGDYHEIQKLKNRFSGSMNMSGFPNNWENN